MEAAAERADHANTKKDPRLVRIIILFGIVGLFSQLQLHAEDIGLSLNATDGLAIASTIRIVATPLVAIAGIWLLVEVAMSVSKWLKSLSAQSRKRVAYVAAATLLLAGVFYWFFYRPASIRSACDAKARDFANIEGTTTFYANRYEPTYTACLHSHGI